MSDTFYFSKYEQGLDIVEIAKRLRREIKAAVKVGDLPDCKYSVRISRYSMGQSLHVSITKTPFPINNRGYLEIEHELSQCHKDYDWRIRYNKHQEMPRWTQEATDLIPKVESLANQWNYDGSDSQTGYYHVNYSMSVDYGDSHDEWVEMREEIKNGTTTTTSTKRESTRQVEPEDARPEVSTGCADSGHYPRLANLPY